MIVVAGIGNDLLGDDGFGPTVARSLEGVDLGPGVELRDVGLRSLHLAYDVADDVEALIVLDLVAVDEAPGTVVVLDPDVDRVPAAVADGHGLGVAPMLELARRIGAGPGLVRVVGTPPVDCRPGQGLSPAVAGAVEAAGTIVVDLVGRLRRGAACSDA